MGNVYDLDEVRIALDEKEILEAINPHRKEVVSILVEKGWIPEEFLIPRNFEEAETLIQGKGFKVELQKIEDNISFFIEKRDDYQEEKLRQGILEAFCKELEEEQPAEKFHLLIPKREWVYRDRDWLKGSELCNFAETLGGYTATRKEYRLALAMMIIERGNSGLIWDEFTHYGWKDCILLESGGITNPQGECEEMVDLVGGEGMPPLATLKPYQKGEYYKTALPCVVLQSL